MSYFRVQRTRGEIFFVFKKLVSLLVSKFFSRFSFYLSVRTYTTMIRFTRSILTLSAVKHSRSITSFNCNLQKSPEKEICEEETIEDEALDNFTKEFLGNQIKVTEFQRILLTAGSSIASLLDPRRHDMIACLGETTGEQSLQKVLQLMQEDDEGREILKQKPRINTKTVNFEELKNMPEESMGFHYWKFLDDNVSFKNLT